MARMNLCMYNTLNPRRYAAPIQLEAGSTVQIAMSAGYIVVMMFQYSHAISMSRTSCRLRSRKRCTKAGGLK